MTQAEVVETKPSDLPIMLKHLLRLKPNKKGQSHVSRPVFIWGAPGIGKTDIVKSVARDLEVPVFTFIAAQCDPTDIKGIPMQQDGQTVWCTPKQLPDAKTGPCILFFDELPNAPVSVQNSLQQLILERKCGDYVLPDNVMVVAAGNRIADRAGAGKLTTPISSRFVHINLEANFQDFCRWGEQKGDIEGQDHIHPMILAFLRFRNALFHVFDKDTKNQQTFPCPRTYEFLSQVLYSPQIVNKQVREAVYAGTIGKGAAIEFMAFEEIYQNITPIDEILRNPEGVPVPKTIAGKFAVASGVSRSMNEFNVDSALKFLDRISDKEYDTMAVSWAVERDPKIASHPSMLAWQVKNSKANLAK